MTFLQFLSLTQEHVASSLMHVVYQAMSFQKLQGEMYPQALLVTSFNGKMPNM